MEKKKYPRIDSTNGQARRMLEQGEINKTTWIQAEDQYQGKGQGKNSWESEPGQNVTGSLVIFPSGVLPENQFDLSIMASLAVCDMLELFLEKVQIKWPNDIYVGSKKIGGLLVEHSILGQEISNSIIGIGLNVNQESFHKDLPNPVSLKQIVGLEVDVEELVNLLLACFSERLKDLDDLKGAVYREEYKRKLYRFKEYAPYRSQNKWFQARIIDIGNFGHLVLETEKGERIEYGFKEVEFIED